MASLTRQNLGLLARLGFSRATENEKKYLEEVGKDFMVYQKGLENNCMAVAMRQSLEMFEKVFSL